MNDMQPWSGLRMGRPDPLRVGVLPEFRLAESARSERSTMTTATRDTQTNGMERFPFHGTRRHPPQDDHEEARIPAAFWLTFLFLGSVALGLVCWGAYRSLPERNREKTLRMAEGASTLKGVDRTRVERAPLTAPPAPVSVARKESLEPPLWSPPPPPPPGFPVDVPKPPELPPPLPPRVELPMPPEVDLPRVELPTAEPPLLVKPPVGLPPPPLIEPPPVELPVVQMPQPPALADDRPLVFARATDLGETPMLRNWKTLAFCSLTIIAIAQPAPVAAGDDIKALSGRFDKLDDSLKEAFKNLHGDIKNISDDLKSFKNQLNKIQADLGALQAEVLKYKIDLDDFDKRMKKVETQLGKMAGDMEDLRKRLDEPSRAVAPAVDKAGFEEIKSKLTAIEKAILGLAPTTARTAFSPPAANTGRVMLVNSYAEMLLFIINGKEHRVAGGTSLPIDSVPSGSLTYEVISPTWGLRARRTTTLGAGETFTLSAQ